MTFGSSGTNIPDPFRPAPSPFVVPGGLAPGTIVQMTPQQMAASYTPDELARLMDQQTYSQLKREAMIGGAVALVAIGILGYFAFRRRR
jgi:hypothetical protein